MPNTHRRRDETVLSRRRQRCEHNLQLAHDDYRRIRSTIWKLTKQTPSLFDYVNFQQWWHNDIIVEKVINIYQNWCNQTLWKSSITTAHYSSDKLVILTASSVPAVPSHTSLATWFQKHLSKCPQSTGAITGLNWTELKRYAVWSVSKIVDRIHRQSSWASSELCSHRRHWRNKTLGGVYWA